MTLPRLLLRRIAILFALALPGQAAMAQIDPKDVDGLKLLLLGPKDNDIKTCADQAFALTGAVFAWQRRTDDQIVADMTDTPADDRFHDLRKRDAELWKSSHSLPKMANYHFEQCVRQTALPNFSGLGPLGETCFSLDIVPIYATIMKKIHRSREETTEQGFKTWGSKLSLNWVKGMVDEIYDTDDEERIKLIYRRVFAGCVETNNPANNPANKPANAPAK